MHLHCDLHPTYRRGSQGVRCTYWRLCDSYRDFAGVTCRRDLINVGRLDGFTQDDINAVAKIVTEKSKDHDCKLIVLALVVNSHGFPKHYQLFDSRMTDTDSLQKIIDSLDEQMKSLGVSPIVVMDAGISTEDNSGQFLEIQRVKVFHKADKNGKLPASATDTYYWSADKYWG